MTEAMRALLTKAIDSHKEALADKELLEIERTRAFALGVLSACQCAGILPDEQARKINEEIAQLRTLSDVPRKFSAFGPDFMNDGRSDQEQAPREKL